jgi:hypothetical protein
VLIIRCDLGRMQMHYLPARYALAQRNRPAIKKSSPIVQMECRNCDVAEYLNPHIHWPNVHERGDGLCAANLLEDHLEIVFKFSSAVRPLRKGARIKDGRTVVERQAETLPVEIIEGVDELRERRSDFHVC